MSSFVTALRRSRALAAAPALTLLLATTPSQAVAETQLWIERPNTAPRIQMPSLAPLVKEAEPAVLSIYVESGPKIDPNDPRVEMFKRFGFEVPDFKQQGQGSGFIIHPDGYALTNHHVVEGADKIQVRVGQNPELVNATVVGDDPRTDVALIKLEGKRSDWPAIPLGDSDVLQVGDIVVAIGNPFGLSQSVSMGILSARGRRDVAPSGRRGLYDFLQTDASINPGNSGGPLLNVNGEVIGINSAINAAAQGIGFAIPINLVKKLIPELKKSGRVSRAWIGVAIQKVDQSVAKGLGLDHPRGALVSSVVEKSPGYKAGLKPGDVITKFDGKPIDDASDLPLLAGMSGVGRTVALELVRDGELRSAKVTLEAAPDDDEDERITGRKNGGSPSDMQNPGKIGVRVDTLDDQYRQRLDLPGKVKGAIIVDVARAGVAADAGLQPGDVVTSVNGQPVQNARAFVDALDKVASGGLVKLIVVRRGTDTFVAFVKP
jgi:serine protease Do